MPSYTDIHKTLKPEHETLSTYMVSSTMDEIASHLQQRLLSCVIKSEPNRLYQFHFQFILLFSASTMVPLACCPKKKMIRKLPPDYFLQHFSVSSQPECALCNTTKHFTICLPSFKELFTFKSLTKFDMHTW